MRNLLRKPLPWMVIIECAIVATLLFLAWRMVAAAPAPTVMAPPGGSTSAQAGESTGPVTTGDAARPTPAGRLLPGLNVDAGFWRTRLAELNRGETAFELLEWRLVHSATDAARRYVESVVLPSVVRAQHPRR
jgi:hypothetical protein